MSHQQAARMRTILRQAEDAEQRALAKLKARQSGSPIVAKAIVTHAANLEEIQNIISNISGALDAEPCLGRAGGLSRLSVIR